MAVVHEEGIAVGFFANRVVIAASNHGQGANMHLETDRAAFVLLDGPLHAYRRFLGELFGGSENFVPNIRLDTTH